MGIFAALQNIPFSSIVFYNHITHMRRPNEQWYIFITASHLCRYIYWWLRKIYWHFRSKKFHLFFQLKMNLLYKPSNSFPDIYSTPAEKVGKWLYLWTPTSHCLFGSLFGQHGIWTEDNHWGSSSITCPLYVQLFTVSDKKRERRW